MRRLVIAVTVLLPVLCPAQTIEKIKLTDNELNCSQIYGEIGDMDKIIGSAKSTRDASATTSTAADVAQTAGGHAVQAAASAGNYGAALGLARAMPFVGMFGSVAKGVSETKQRESAEQFNDAKARKEHLTELFINRGCKMSEMKVAEAQPTASQQAAAPSTAVVGVSGGQ